MRISTLSTFLLLLPALAACQRHDAPPPAREPHAVAGAVPTVYASEAAAFTVTEVVAGLEHPWSLAFLPDGDMLVTERPGRLRRIARDGQVSAPIAGVPAVYVEGQAGLLDVALSPGFATDGLVYLAFAEPNLRGNLCGERGDNQDGSERFHGCAHISARTSRAASGRAILCAASLIAARRARSPSRRPSLKTSVAASTALTAAPASSR